MKNKRKFRLILIFVLIAAMISATYLSFAESQTVTQEEYDKAHEEAKAAQEATEAKRKEAKNAAKKAAEAVANFEEAEKQLEVLTGDIENKKVEIANTEALIENKLAEIEAKKAEIKAKEEEIEEQNTALNNRLTAMYKNGNAGMVDVLLNSESMEDLLSNVGMVHRILDSDEKLLKKLQKDYKKLRELKEELEQEKNALEAERAALVDQQIGLEAKEVETEELKKRYQKEADEMHALQAQKEAEAAEMAAEAKQKQLEAERMIVDAGGDVDVAPGEYAWPTASNWELSDKYGWRICPFHGKEFHNGLDIVLTSGTKGAPVYAIADGYVTRASWYGGYGNCIQYAVGNGYSVLYGHLSGYNCKAGQYVTKGSVLGYIGSTGASTGPHLHFTVFQNGEHINPFSLY